jgi:hypothetical protein
MMTTRKHLAPVALMIVLGLGGAQSAALAGQGRGRGNGRGEEKAEAARDKTEGRGNGKAAKRDDVIVIDREGHRRIVRDYYTSNALPPGLAKRQSLPPGLQKQLRERGTLPPGLQKQLTPVPPALGGRLPGVPAYYSRYFAGRDMVVVDTRSNRIVSIIRDVIP